MNSDGRTGAARGRGWARWLIAAASALVLVAVVAVGVFAVATRNPSPSAFYEPPDKVPPQAGEIIRSERFGAGVPADAEAWRVLYASSDAQGTPIAVSGLVVVPRHAPAGPRPVLAWAHGTTGVEPPCAPSLSKDPFKNIPDMSGPLGQGWVVTMTDYPGLGTPAPHPYLVGESEGRAVLDSVRAAHHLADAVDLGVALDNHYAIWGHSQGGHAALFAGQLAPGYLPELPLVGVAALAPATTLRDDFKAIEGTVAGNLLTIYAIASWARYYAPDITLDVLLPAARKPAEIIAAACLNQPSRFRLLVGGLVLPDRIVAGDVTDDPAWSTRMIANTPRPDGVAAPIFVAQGLADEVVSAPVTEAWVDQRCAAEAEVELRTYPGVDHVGVVGPGGTDALAWTIGRFAGKVPADTCPTN